MKLTTLAPPRPLAPSHEPFRLERSRGGATEGRTPASPEPGVSQRGGAPANDPPPAQRPTVRRELSSIVLLASALYSALALASFRSDPSDPSVHGADWVGPVGASVSTLLVTAIGLTGWLLPLELIVLARPLVDLRRHERRTRIELLTRLSGDFVVATVIAALVHVAFPEAKSFGAMPAGGQVGELAGELMRSLFSGIGSYIIGLTLVTLILVGRASFSFLEGFRRSVELVEALGDKGLVGARAVLSAWREARAIDVADRGVDRAPRIGEDADELDSLIAELSDDEDRSRRVAVGVVLASETPAPTGGRVTSPRDTAEPALDVRGATAASDEVPTVETRALAPLEEPPTPSPVAPARGARKSPSRPVEIAETPAPDDEVPPAVEPTPSAPPAAPIASVPTPEPRTKQRPPERKLAIVDTSAALAVERIPTKVVPAIGAGFRLPTPDLLDAIPTTGPAIDEVQLKNTAALLEKTLSDYGVSGRVEEIHPGPTVTTFEVSPAAGTKVSKVASLADDLALGLSRKVRIIAPIPGKNRIGFEIPNAKRSPVSLRDLIEDRRFAEMNAPLPCVLGRDIVGAPSFADIASMPHVIVAGATGAGKSVGLNVILVSLLYQRTPDELRLLMIDPKVVELAPFEGIPHMLLPVVTDMKQAANALKWAVDEMERRYQLFANAGTKNIGTYNGLIERVLRGEAKAPRPMPNQKVTAVAADGTDVELAPAKDGTDAEPPKKLPFIVIVVDEFADLMMQQGKEVEVSVARLAQKARAAGMHVILATQRPSVDVITGMIKANFPTRVAFRVAQKVDSRTILDEQGAEHLLGRGDMLVKLNGTNDVRRVQCPFISEEETQRVTDFLRLQGTPEYDEDILKPRDEDGAVEDDDGEQDAMYDQAVRIVAETRRCSTSWLQRKLGIGYNRAANIVETMERRGLVGPANGAKDREVLIDPI